jgi:hypothetical protein
MDERSIDQVHRANRDGEHRISTPLWSLETMSIVISGGTMSSEGGSSGWMQRSTGHNSLAIAYRRAVIA